MNNVGEAEPNVDNGLQAMFAVPFTYRCTMRKEFVRRWCNTNKDMEMKLF